MGQRPRRRPRLFRAGLCDPASWARLSVCLWVLPRLKGGPASPDAPLQERQSPPDSSDSGRPSYDRELRHPEPRPRLSNLPPVVLAPGLGVY